MSELDELPPREDACVVACAEYAYPCADLDSVADDDEACVEDCYAVVISIITVYMG